MRSRSIESLIQAAMSVRERAHAPYSRFKVGAAIRDETGAVHAGANVENASYSMCQCAEASAIGVMIAAGGREIKEIAIVGGGSELCTPCGGCRQRIREFAKLTASIHIAGPEGYRKTFSLAELLPAAFGPENLD